MNKMQWSEIMFSQGVKSKLVLIFSRYEKMGMLWRSETPYLLRTEKTTRDQIWMPFRTTVENHVIIALRFM